MEEDNNITTSKNKKKIIIISSITAVVVVVAVIICIIVFSGGDKVAEDKETPTPTPTTEQTSSKEETETSTELQTTELQTTETESQTTEIGLEETSKSNGQYVYAEDIQNIDDAYAYFESLGYKLSNPVTADEVRAIYKDFPNAMTAEELEEGLNLDTRLALCGLAWGILPSNPNAVVEERPTGSSNIVIGSYVKPNKEEVTTSSQVAVDKTPEILQWIKDNYGDKFVFDNLTYIYNSEEKQYYVYRTEEAHKMTSATTSEIVNVYIGEHLYSINQVGVILGCPSATEKNEWVMGFGGSLLFDENFNVVSYKENTEKYIKKPGCEEAISWFCNWDFMTSEGIPVDVYDEGYINVEVLYPNSTERVNEHFTIEEYYKFLNKYAGKYYIGTQTGKRGWFGDGPDEMEDYIDEWVVIIE